MMTTFTDVMDSHCTVQRNPKFNSMTGNRFETLAKGEIPRLEIYESHKALVDAADNWADAGTTRPSAGEGLQQPDNNREDAVTRQVPILSRKGYF